MCARVLDLNHKARQSKRPFPLSVSTVGCVSGLTCVEAVLVSGAVAVKGEGGARESAACCCWDSSEAVAPMVTVTAPDVEPSVAEKTPAIKSARTALAILTAEQRNLMCSRSIQLLVALQYVFTLMHYFNSCNNMTRFQC